MSSPLRTSFVAEHVAALPKSGIRAFFDIVAQRQDVISLGVGEPDFDTPWHISRAATVALEEGRTHYTSNLGMPTLRQEICSYLNRRFGAAYAWENETLVTVGVAEAIDLALRAVCSPGDEVLYHEPCFVSYAPTIRLAHAVPVPVETRAEEGFRLTVDALEKKVTPRTKVLLVNFPCNPTGATLTEADRQAIADFCVRHDLLLLSDEVYAELVYDGEPVSFASLPVLRDRLVLLNGFSKAWAMTGFRLGFACGPADLIDAMMKIHQYSIMCASTTAQEAATEALRNGTKYMEEMREKYRERRDIMVKGFNDIGLTCIVPQGAFYAFPSIVSTGLNSTEFAEGLLKSQRVAVVPGTAFGACGEGFIRCCYAASSEEIIEALKRIGAFLNEIKK